MKLLTKILLLILIVLILCFIGLAVYVKYYGQEAVRHALRDSLKRDVSFAELTFRPPFDLQATDVNVPHLVPGKKFFTAKKITARMSFATILQGKLVFSEVQVEDPVVVIEKEAPEGAPESPERRYGTIVPPPEDKEEEKAPAGPGSAPAGIEIRRFILKNGDLQYTNRGINEHFSFALEDVFMKINHIAFPFKEEKTEFSLAGRLIKEGNPLNGSSVEGSGWVDLVGRNMDAAVEVVESDGTVGMTARAESTNNDMHVHGDLKFQNILMGADEESPSDMTAVNNLLSGALSSAGVEIGAKFSFRTKMDDFRPANVSFTGNVVTK